MTNGRATTFDERVEIVKYCIEHDRNYSETVEKYKVSYQQVRNWIVKFNNFESLKKAIEEYIDYYNTKR